MWKKMEWCENYYINNSWKIKSLGFSKQRILKQQESKKWYIYVRIKYEKIWWKYRRVHRLVAQAFIPNPENKPQVNHKDWNKQNNCVNNLEWCTASENQLHSFKIWLNKWSMFWKKWEHSSNHKKINQYTKEWDFIKTWDCMINASETLWISYTWICWCCRWKYWYKTAWWFKRAYS